MQQRHKKVAGQVPNSALIDKHENKHKYVFVTLPLPDLKKPPLVGDTNVYIAQNFYTAQNGVLEKQICQD